MFNDTLREQLEKQFPKPAGKSNPRCVCCNRYLADCKQVQQQIEEEEKVEEARRKCRVIKRAAQQRLVNELKNFNR